MKGQVKICFGLLNSLETAEEEEDCKTYFVINLRECYVAGVAL